MLREMHMGTLGSNWGLQRRVSLFCFVFSWETQVQLFPQLWLSLFHCPCSRS